MPSSMLHLFVAKKIDPSASIDFYIGNIAPDAQKDRNIKAITHLRNAPDREVALKDFARKVNSDYLKGMLLHLFVDWKWEETVISDFAKKEGQGWYTKYNAENTKMVSFAFHSTEWADGLWEQMEMCEDFGFSETECITKQDVKSLISHQRKWQMENKLGSSSSFPPALIDKFADSAADDFNRWWNDKKERTEYDY